MKEFKLTSHLTCYEFDDLSDEVKSALMDRLRRSSIKFLKNRLEFAMSYVPQDLVKCIFQSNPDESVIEEWIKERVKGMTSENYFTKDGGVIGSIEDILASQHSADKLRELLKNVDEIGPILPIDSTATKD